MILESNHSVLMDAQSEESATNDGNGSLQSRSFESQPLRRSNRGRGRNEQGTIEGGGSASDQPIKNCTFADTEYSINDYVYYEISNGSYYSIGYIEGIDDRDKDKIKLSVRCYIRTFDVPEACKDIIDRKFRMNSLSPSVMSNILAREIFNADTLVDIDLNQLRGKCYVKSFTRLSDALHNFDPSEEDVFFNTYCYKAESQHLIPVSPHVKIGCDYQVTEFPAYRGPHPRKHICLKHWATSNHFREKHSAISESGDRPPFLGTKRRHSNCRVTGSPNENCRCEEPRKTWEELIWNPHFLELDQPLDPDEYNAVQGSIETYLAAVRSIVAFATIGGAPSDSEAAQNGKAFAESMATTQHALDTLHKCDYDIARAILEIQVNPVAAKNTPMHWTTEQVKQFITGIRHCGRNFHEIQKRYFSATTGIDPFGSRQSLPPTYLRSSRGRRRRRGNPVELSGNVESIPHQEETEASETINTPTNEGTEENIGEPADEEVVESPSLAELEGKYLFVPTVEKTTKELIEFFYFWKKKNAQQYLSFVGVKTATTTVANDEKCQKASTKAETKKGRMAEAGSGTCAVDGDSGRDISSGTGNAPNAFMGISPDSDQTVATESAITLGSNPVTCKFCSDGVMNSEMPKASLSLAQIPQINPACARCRLYYFKYGYMPGRAKDRLTYSSEPARPLSDTEAEGTAAIGNVDVVKKDGQDSPCRCCVSPTYVSCFSSPVHSQEDEWNNESLVITEIEEQKAATQQPPETSRPETIAVDGYENESATVEPSTLDHKCSCPDDHGTVTPVSNGGCTQTDARAQKFGPSTDMASIFNNMDKKWRDELQQSLWESLRRGSGTVEQQQATFGPRQQVPSNAELLRNVMHQMDPDPQPLNLRASTASRPSLTSAGSASVGSTSTTTTHAKGTFYPPTGVPPPSGSSASSTNRNQHQSSRGSGRSSANLPSSTSSIPPKTYIPPPVNSTSIGLPHFTESLISPASISHFLRDQQTASYQARPANIHQIQQHHHHQHQQQEQLFSEVPGFMDQDIQKYLEQVKLHSTLSHQQQIQQQRQNQQQKQNRDQRPYPPRESAEALRAQQVMTTQSENSNSLPDQTAQANLQQQQYLQMLMQLQHQQQLATSSRTPISQTQMTLPFHILQSLQSAHTSRDLYNQQQQNLRYTHTSAASSDSFQQGAPVFYPQLPQQHQQQQQQQQAHQAQVSLIQNSFAELVRLFQRNFASEGTSRQPGIAHQHGNQAAQMGQVDYRRILQLLSGQIPTTEEEIHALRLCFAIMMQEQQMKSQRNQGPYGGSQQ